MHDRGIGTETCASADVSFTRYTSGGRDEEMKHRLLKALRRSLGSDGELDDLVGLACMAQLCRCL